VEDIYGLALQGLRPFEDVPRRPVHAAITTPCTDKKCDICRRGCIYHAVSFDRTGYRIDPAVCCGCGYCVDACPYKRIVLESLPPTEYR
jgi:heterodisulfide reductase subunit A-like polyferredoxin